MGRWWRSQGDTNERARLGRVLIVDDEDCVRQVLRTMLTNAGYDVEEADDGGRAVEVLNSGDNPLMVDVIICDIRMPKINGTEAIAYFRAQYPSVPVIVLTGYHEPQLASSLIQQGVIEHLAKPADREKILMSVADAMERRTISFYP